MHNELESKFVLPNDVSETSEPLRTQVERSLKNYFSQLGDTDPSNLYELVIAEVELPLLEVVLKRTRGNQTKTAKLLGLSRGTLRKKLKRYQLD
jgi:DNA-binding protein Fis